MKYDLKNQQFIASLHNRLDRETESYSRITLNLKKINEATPEILETAVLNLLNYGRASLMIENTADQQICLAKILVLVLWLLTKYNNPVQTMEIVKTKEDAAIILYQRNHAPEGGEWHGELFEVELKDRSSDPEDIESQVYKIKIPKIEFKKE